MIKAPYPSLLHCQNWIYNNILTSQKYHSSAHGFTKGKSIVTNANPHLQKLQLLKIDIKDFFPSIKLSWVINIFLELGYAHNVSYYLASICCLENSLPQGAATSPALSNLAMRKLDEKIENISKKHEITFTRYADDLTFSGDYISLKFIECIAEVLSAYGFEINHNKTRLYRRKSKRIVTGISVSGEKLSIPRSLKRELKKEIYYIKKFGYDSHRAKKKISNFNYIESIIGKLSFWKQVEPENEFVLENIRYFVNLKKNIFTEGAAPNQTIF